MSAATSDLLRLPAFRRLFAGRVLASLAAGAAPILLAFAVLDVRASASVLGLVLAARSVPQIVLVLLGGVLADRFARHRIALVSLLVATVTQATVAALILGGSVQVWQLAAVEAVNGAATAFLMPATEALTGTTVPADRLKQAVAVLRIGMTTASTAGAALGGVLLVVSGTGWGFALDALAFGLAAALMARMSSATTEQADDAPGRNLTSPLRDLREGWHEFRSRRWLLVVVAQFFVINAVLAGAWSTLGPVVAVESTGRGGWGLVSAGLSVGMVLGGLLALRLNVRRLLWLGVTATLLIAPALLVLGLRPSVPALLVAVLVGGAAIEVFEISWQVSIQEKVPEAALSRVFAFEQLGTFAAIPVGQLAAGPVALALGTRDAVVAAGVLAAVTSLWALSTRSVRGLEHDPRTSASGGAEHDEKPQPQDLGPHATKVYSAAEPF